MWSLYKLQLVQVQNLYMLQLVQVYLYKLQLVQAVCTSCNLYKKSVQVATCTKSQLVHNIYIYTLGMQATGEYQLGDICHGNGLV